MTLIRFFRTLVCWLVVLSSVTVWTAYAEDQPTQDAGGAAETASYAITGIRADQSAEAYALRVLCSGFPTYNMYELYDPLRLMLDIANASLADSFTLPLNFAEGPVTLIQGQKLADKDPPVMQLELFLAEQRSYAVEREGNDIVITFPSKATEITGIDVEKEPTATRVLIRTNGTVTEYRKGELPDEEGQPARMYLDINDISFAFPERVKKVGTSLAKMRMGNRDNGVRIVFDSGLPGLFSYNILSSNKGLEVVIQEAPDQILSGSSKKRITTTVTDVQATGRKTAKTTAVTLTEMGTKQPAADTKKPAMPATKQQEVAADTFTDAGYNKQRITVDFYKIDLHNVFRLFGEISGLNIVVDEAVNGSLTLSLNDVPWDFALDVILNLKDLQKEERFNTIVISPKSKTFQWPERPTESLAVSADGKPTTVESLSVQKRIETPKEVIEAKRLIKLGRAAESDEDFTTALDSYEKAFALWPENGRLADRLASLYLTREGMNAKAVYYAKEALKIDSNDRSAALYAAIGLANMKQQQAAQEYFDRAVSDADGTKPAKEALVSYAVFDEENGNYVGALLLLARHGQLYGDSLETMVAKARIYEKEGNVEKALAEYRTIMLSGYELPPDLSRYIKGRLAQNKTK